MKPIRILIVEDEEQPLAVLRDTYRRILASRGYQPTLEQACNVEEARQLAKAAAANPYDLVSLDVDLGDRELTGLDVLATLKRFHSAWMVVLLTGVESSATVDQTMGTTKGSRLRKQLRRDAYANFPPERLLVVEKPSTTLPNGEAQRLLANRLEQISLVYEEVGRLRYVFRPIEVEGQMRVPVPKGTKAKRKCIKTTALHWQIRFNCGEILTLPDAAGFRTLHYMLSLDRNQSITPEESLAIEPKAERNASPAQAGTDPIASFFEAQGIDWKGLSAQEQQTHIRAALSLKMKRFVELRELQDENDLLQSEEEELERIKGEFGPLADAAEGLYRLKTSEQENEDARREKITTRDMCEEGLHLEGGNYDRLGTGRRGLDSPAAQLFRARMKRVRDCLRENGFADFAQHIRDFIQPAGGRWSYNPPEVVEWTT